MSQVQDLTSQGSGPPQGGPSNVQGDIHTGLASNDKRPGSPAAQNEECVDGKDNMGAAAAAAAAQISGSDAQPGRPVLPTNFASNDKVQNGHKIERATNSDWDLTLTSETERGNEDFIDGALMSMARGDVDRDRP